MEKGLCGRDADCEHFKDSSFPTFSESYFVSLGLFSAPSSDFLYSTSAFDNTHKLTI